MQILEVGLILPMPNVDFEKQQETEKTIADHFGYKSIHLGCTLTKGISIYNSVMENYLEKANGKGWRTRQRQMFDSVLEAKTLKQATAANIGLLPWLCAPEPSGSRRLKLSLPAVGRLRRSAWEHFLNSKCATAASCGRCLQSSRISSMNKQIQIDALLEFKRRDKFSTEAWNARGLNPSSENLCQQLTTLFDNCVDRLVSAINNNSSNRQLKSALKSGLKAFGGDYDTEEKEFISDLFYQLAAIINVYIKDDISKWLYGSALNNVFKLNKLLNKQSVEMRKQPCSNCAIQLESHIVQKQKGIPDSSWFIIKCSNCGELNLLSPGPDIKQINFGNYQWIETLSKDEYSYEEAMTRLQQIKFFKK